MVLYRYMSDIVQMTADYDEFLNGNVYRVRSSFADHRELENKLIILDTQPEPSNTVEGE